MFMFHFQIFTEALEFQTVVLAKKILGYFLCFFCIDVVLTQNSATVNEIALCHVLFTFGLSQSLIGTLGLWDTWNIPIQLCTGWPAFLLMLG